MIGRWPASIFLAIGFAISANAEATAPGPESSRSAAKPYEDRLIEGLAGGEVVEPEAAFDTEGWPRSLRIEAFSSQFRRADGTTRENGLTLSARLDTPLYGAFSLDGAYRQDPNATLFTLWQRGMPFDGGWIANNGLGMLNTPSLSLARQQYRFYLPTFPIVGLATEWLRGRETQLFASVGEPGNFSGLRLSGFSRQGGTLVTAGAQTELSSGVEAALQVAEARSVHNALDPVDPSRKSSARSVFAALAWQEGVTRTQLNLLDSETNARRHQLGAWIDAETRVDRMRHNFGAFRLYPDLNWGVIPVAGDVQGGYYRLQYQSLRWTWNAGIDGVASVSASTANSWFGTASGRYQWDRTTGLGGGITTRHSQGDAVSGYAFVDKNTELGATRAQVDVARTDTGDHSRLLTLDQTLPTGVGLRMSTSLSIGSEDRAGTRTRRTSLALVGSADLTNRLYIDANLRWTRSRAATATVGRYANVSLNWRFNSRWSLAMTYYDNRAESQDLLTVNSPIPVSMAAPVPKDRALFLIVRYEDQAGTPVAPLGGSRGSGAGSISGVVFLDLNDNGLQDAGEAGAANVTVLLDGRFSTRTDPQGRFEFPMVATGSHQILVVPDNLPLPFQVAGEGRVPVEVKTRDISRVSIAASRVK